MKIFLKKKSVIYLFALLYSLKLSAVCDNVTVSGIVTGDETGCGSYNPSAITNVTYPTGGTGTLIYQWQFSTDGNTWTNISYATNAEYDPPPMNVTTYYHRLEGRVGCTVYGGTSNVITKTVNPLPIASITAGGPVDFCGPVNVTLTANVAAGTNYQWIKNSSIIPGATNISYTAILPGQYYIKETITSTGCESFSNEIIVTSNTNSPPLIDYTKTFNGCDTSLGLLSTNMGDGNNFQWYEDGSLLPGSTLPYCMTGHNGTFSCTITNACGIFFSTPYVVNDTLLDMMPFGVISSNGINSICSGQSINIYETTMVNAVNYQWFKDGVAIPGAYSNLYIASQFGTYTLRFTIPCMMWGGVDPIDFYSNAITITNNGGTAPVPSISAGGSTTLCSGQSVQLNEVTGAGWTYQWKLGANDISGATNPTYSAASEGSYSCAVTNMCGTYVSNILIVTIQPSSETISMTGSTTICLGSSAVLTSTPAGLNGTYQWQRNGSNITGATQSSYSATTTGSYTCTISNSCTTITSNSIAITISGVCGTGLLFDGNDYVRIPNNAAYSFGTNNFTIEVWVKLDMTQNYNYRYLLSNRSSGSNDGFIIDFLNGKLGITWGGTNISGGPDLRDNTCHHIAVSRSSTSLVSFYVDGNLAYTSTLASYNITTSNQLLVGNDVTSNGYLKGYVMDIRIWNASKTQTQIQASMNTELYGNEPNLVGYWKLNDGSGQVCYDYSPMHNYGLLGSSSYNDTNDPSYQASCAISPATLCQVPTVQSTTYITNTSANLYWQMLPADTFLVRYAVHNTTNFVWKKIPGPLAYFTTITGLLPGTTYDWCVRTLCNSGSSSNYSSTLTFTTQSTPIPCITPYGLAASNIANTSATISWTTMVTADTFRVRYSVNGTTNFIWKDVNGASGASTTLSGLSPNTAYQFQVSSKCNGVTSPYSTSFVFTTLNTPVPCITPYGLGASNIQNTSATITWTNLVTADTFRVRYSVNGTTNFIWKDVNGGGGSSTSLTSLIPNTTYQFQVSSKCNGITSAYSNSFVFTTLNTPVPCIVPYGLSTTNITNNSAKVNWTNLVSADTFRVRYSINGTTNYMWKDVNGGGGTTNTTLTGLNSSSTYQWQVRTVCNGAQSAYSSSVIFSTAAMREAAITGNGFENLNVYPNPAHSKATAEFTSDKSGNGAVTVTDMAGRILLTETFTIREGMNVLEIDVATLPRGIYLVQLQNQDAASVMVKLTVE